MHKKWFILVALITTFVLTICTTALAFNNSVNTEVFKGDGKYLLYPKNHAGLARESIVIANDAKDGIYKIYSYDKSGKLTSIHLPQYNLSLFIEGKKDKTRYYIADEEGAYRIIGGNFPNLNFQYAGGAGLSDIAVESSILNKIIDISQENQTKLTKAIEKYNAKNKTPLTKEEFNRPLNLKHPLMTIKSMNLAYFFDGHGQRLKYDITSKGKVSVTSVTLSKDVVHQKEIDSAFDDIFGDLGKFFLKFIITPLILGSLILGVTLFMVFRKKMQL